MFAKYSTLSPNAQRFVRVVVAAVLITVVMLACLGIILKQQSAEREKLVSWHGDERVVMYSTSSCSNCRNARMYFAAKGIEYVEFNMEESAEYHKRYVELAGSGTPLLYVDHKRMDGFNNSQFEQLYTP